MRRYRAEVTPLTVKVRVSPLVTWIWVGAAIIFAGGLIALWPETAAGPEPRAFLRAGAERG